MIRKEHEQKYEEASNIRGGNGTAKIRHLFSSEEMDRRVRLCERIIVEPGVSFGAHRHVGEAEFYYVLEGEVVTGKPGEGVAVRKGDAIYTREGEAHYLENIGDRPAELLAIVFGSGEVEVC